MTQPYGDPNSIQFQSVDVQPIEKLKQAKQLLGEQYWLFVVIALVAMLIGGAVPLGILMGPMLCGLYLCYQQRVNGQTSKFELLFKGFDFFVESLIATLIIMGISAVFIVPLVIGYMLVFATAIAAENEALMFSSMAGFYLLLILFSILIYVPFLFTYPLIVEHNLKGWDAVKLSTKASMENLGSNIKLVLVFGILSILATFCCYFPVFLLLPLTFGGVYLYYREVFAGSIKTAEPPVKPAKGV